MHLNKISTRNIFTFCSHTVQGQCSALCSLKLVCRRSRRSAFAVTKALSVDSRGHRSVSTVGIFRLLTLLLLLSHPSCPPFFLFPPTLQTGSPPRLTLSSFLSVFNLYHFTLEVHSRMLWLVFKNVPLYFLSHCPLALVLTRTSGRRQWVEKLAYVTKANRGGWCPEARCQSISLCLRLRKEVDGEAMKSIFLALFEAMRANDISVILLSFYYVICFNIRQH